MKFAKYLFPLCYVIFLITLYSCASKESFDSNVVNGWILTSMKTNDIDEPKAKGFFQITDMGVVNGKFENYIPIDRDVEKTVTYSFTGETSTKNNELELSLSISEGEEYNINFLFGSEDVVASYTFNNNNKEMELTLKKEDRKKIYKFVGIKGEWQLKERKFNSTKENATGMLSLMEDGTYMKEISTNGTTSNSDGNFSLISTDSIQFDITTGNGETSVSKVKKITNTEMELESSGNAGGTPFTVIEKYSR